MLLYGVIAENMLFTIMSETFGPSHDVKNVWCVCSGPLSRNSGKTFLQFLPNPTLCLKEEDVTKEYIQDVSGDNEVTFKRKLKPEEAIKSITEEKDG